MGGLAIIERCDVEAGNAGVAVARCLGLPQRRNWMATGVLICRPSRQGVHPRARGGACAASVSAAPRFETTEPVPDCVALTLTAVTLISSLVAEWDCKPSGSRTDPRIEARLE